MGCDFKAPRHASGEVRCQVADIIQLVAVFVVERELLRVRKISEVYEQKRGSGFRLGRSPEQHLLPAS